MINKTYPITEKLLDKGLELSLKLYDLLTREQRVLKKRLPAEELARIANDKKDTIIRLEQFSKQMIQVLATENLSLHQQDMAKYFQTALKAGFSIDKATNQWQQISSVGKKCQALNEQNGAAIHLLTRHNHRLMEILRGQPQTATTYGPDGATRGARFSQSLISV